MIGTVTRVSLPFVHVRLAEYPGSEVKARAVRHRIDDSAEKFSTFAADDRVMVIDDDEGGLLAVGVIA